MYQKMKSEEYTNVGGLTQRLRLILLRIKKFWALRTLIFKRLSLVKEVGFTGAYTNSASLALGASNYISNIFNTSICDPSVYGNFALVGSSDGLYKLGFSGTFQNLTKFATFAGGASYKAIVQNVSYKDQTFVNYGVGNRNVKIFTGTAGGFTLTPYYFGSAIPYHNSIPGPSGYAGLTVNKYHSRFSFIRNIYLSICLHR